MSLRVAYLGPAGTFTEQALLTQPDLAAGERVPCPSIPDVLGVTQDDPTVDVGFVAIENSIDGTVNITQDTLAFDASLLIQREVVMPIELDLMVVPGAAIEGVKRVVSFPVAIGQCRRYLREHLPGVEEVAATSTSEAAAELARSGDTAAAAIGPRQAAELHGLERIAVGIQDQADNMTRFVVVAREGSPAPTGHDKTSLVAFQRNDRPGSLLAILQEFAARSINLTKLESRPTKQGLGDYCFLIDLEGHVADDVVADALKNLRAKLADVKFLGSYPAAGDEGPSARASASQAWQDAEAWIADLRSHIR